MFYDRMADLVFIDKNKQKIISILLIQHIVKFIQIRG
jgi:hypothetical protein